MLAATMSAATSSRKLEWRSSGKAATRSTAVPSNTHRTSTQTPVGAARATQINSLRDSQRTIDRSLRPAAFEEEAGPRLEPTSSDPGRSVVVERYEADDELRSAQLSPSAADSSAAPGSPAGVTGIPDATRSTDTQTPPVDLEEPAMNPDELPSFDEPTTQPLQPLPEATEPPPSEQMRQPVAPPVRQPSSEFQPRPPASLGPRDIPGRELPPTPQLSEEKIQEERVKSEKACTEGLQKLRGRTIDQVDLNIAVTGEQGSDFPFECTLGENEWHGGRCWEQTTYMWKASALCHKPLYFEDEQLERYGHSFPPCFQPFVSGAHFFTRLPVLPYCMGVEPPCECVYALGHYRPGNCAPYMCNPIPISPRGALIQAGAVVGTAAALP
jgi:hypothetical protein